MSLVKLLIKFEQVQRYVPDNRDSVKLHISINLFLKGKEEHKQTKRGKKMQNV